MLVMLSCYNLFMREVSKKKFQKLAELAHEDPNPLIQAIKFGSFKAIKLTALQLLENEMGKAKHDNTRRNFREIIDTLNNQL